MKIPANLDAAVKEWPSEFKKDWVYEEIFKAALFLQALILKHGAEKVESLMDNGIITTTEKET